MAGEEIARADNLVDARGNEVWAATRFLPDTDWGLVVKIDAEEGEGPGGRAYRKNLTDVVISLAALAILFGTFLGLRFAKPIHELSKAADRIRAGDLSARARGKFPGRSGLAGPKLQPDG